MLTETYKESDMAKKITYILLCFCFCITLVHGQKANYQIFDNISLGTEASVTNCFLQDGQGMIWIGSNKGLFSYDGYSIQSHFTPEGQGNTWIYCGQIVDNTRLYLGTDDGMLIYNYKTDTYETTPVAFPTDIRSLALQGNTLWIGTLNGLYTYNFSQNTLKLYDTKAYKGLAHSTIYSVIHSADNRIYVGTYNGLSRYRTEDDSFERIPLPATPHKNNQFINSLLEDTLRHCIWIGTEGTLLKYTPADGNTEPIETVHANSVKSLALDGDHSLLIGTDNGLYIYKENAPVLHTLHDSRNLQSLANNIIWNIFADRERNIWLGTNYGISLSHYDSTFRYVPIAQMTGTGEGNQFFSIFKDSRDNYWFGGSNGIIRSGHPAGNMPDATWYKMGDPQHNLAHNRIRHIYEDRNRELWIATDGSVNRYNYANGQFIHYNIVDSTGKYNANWAYHLMEDEAGKLWIATCLGGIFVVDKQKMMRNNAEYHVAEYNFSTDNGLSGMFINQLIPDREGNVWVLLYNNGIDRINIRTRKVDHLQTDSLTAGNKPNFILCDEKGLIWAGFRSGVLRIDPRSNEIKTVSFGSFSNNEIFSMLEVEDCIWISTSNGFWVVDKLSLHARRLNPTSRRFFSMFYDKPEREIYLGDVDGFAVTVPDILSIPPINRPIIATSLSINGNLINRNETSIRYADHIELNHNQNNFTIEFSDLPYSLEEKNKFVYQLNGVDQDWNLLKPNTNRITYNNLDYRSYVLTVSKLDANGNPSDDAYTLHIRVNPPWYYTLWAKIIYSLLLAGLVIWAVNFFRMKNRLHMERMEKEKIMEQSRQKIDFFTNLSHDFKTPLSLIIAPISKLLPEVKNREEKKLLEGVQRNAIKLNSLIHEVLDFNRVDSDSNTLLILSHTDMVEFARTQLQIYEEAAKEKNIIVRFETNREEIYLNIDLIKWESILNNLLSNALKYTPEGGNITLTLLYKEDEKVLTIRVADTGMGIPQQDIPYIFQRFFQSSHTQGKKEGTGIGLYLVKTYAELHGAEVSIISEEHKGTTVTLTLPAFQEVEILTSTEEKGSAMKGSLDNDFRPLVLVVDDNPEVLEFIHTILHSRYRCIMASEGREGLKHCMELVPDLIITDLMMPVMDGMEMCRHIKKHVPTSTIPIILLTAKDDKETELESIQLDIDAFISKPFEADILLSRVEQLIQKKQTFEAKTRIETISTPKTIEAVSYDEKFLADITRMIEDHVADSDLNVNALCELSGIGNKQMYRKVKQLTGLSPVEYIKTIRMKKAAMLLEQQKFSVAEVMYMVGFSSSSYFSKCFQGEFGVTPKQFMEKEEKKYTSR